MSDLHGVRLGLDLDGVVADYEAAMRSTARQTGIATVGDESPTTWGMIEPGWFDHHEQWLATHVEVFRSGAHTIPLLDSGAPAALNRFRAEGGVVVVTTARSGLPDDGITHEKVYADTEQWFRDHGFIVDDMLFLSDKSAAGCDVHIDDSPGVIQHLSASDIPVVVRDQPYNRHVNAPHRVQSVTEMIDRLFRGEITLR